MTLARHIAVMTVMAVALAACSLPRGAALQREVVSQGASENPTFQVVEVTRAAAPMLATWPSPDEDATYTWPTARRGPDSAVIQAGDTLDVVVWDNQDNSLISAGEKQTPIPPLRVSSRGSVFLPYVGDVTVRGLTREAARDRIQRKMEMIVPDAQVQLSVTQGRNNSVDITGGVSAPGRYPLETRDTRIMSILAIAGGVAGDLRQPRLRLERNGRVYQTLIDEVRADPSQNIRLRGGDQIAVVEDGRTFTALGSSNTQQLVPFEKEEMNALDALSAAGGINASRADPKGVLILRDYHPRHLMPGPKGPDMQQVIFSLDLTSADGLFAARNFMIAPGDTLLATESPVTKVQTITRLFGSVVGFGSTVSNLSD